MQSKRAKLISTENLMDKNKDNMIEQMMVLEKMGFYIHRLSGS